jgi:serine/threonine-protein kinase
MEINDSGGEVRELTRIDTAARERTHRWPDVLPGGKAVIFTVGTAESPDYYEDATIQAYEFGSGEQKLVLRDASSAKYSPTGHLLFTRSGSLYGIRFDEEELETIGEPVQLINGIVGDYTSGAMQYALSENGTLVYVPGGAGDISQNFVKIDPEGNIQAFPAPEDQYFYPRISPDGKRIALCIGSTREMDVYIYEIERNSMVRFTFSGYNYTPVWSPDGKFIAYSSRIDGISSDIIIKRADGTGSARTVWSRDGDYSDITDWSPDGKILALTLGPGEPGDTPPGLFMLNIDNPEESRPFLTTNFSHRRASYSPDMKYIAYSSDRTGLHQIFVQSVKDEGGFWQVSSSPGWAPRWSRDGKYLYYNDSQSRVIMRVPLLPGSGFRFGEPAPIAESFKTPSIDPAFFPFDIFPDGSGFITVVDESQDSRREIVVVLNWFEELKKAF